jgi:hypothetical protein
MKSPKLKNEGMLAAEVTTEGNRPNVPATQKFYATNYNN